MKRVLLLILMLFLLCSTAVAATAEDITYEVLVDLSTETLYDQDVYGVSVEHGVFCTSMPYQKGGSWHKLYSFDGSLLMKAHDIEMTPTCIFVRQGSFNAWGVYSYDLECMIPCEYADVCYIDENTVMAVKSATVYNRGNGDFWYGERHLVDLKTGEMTDIGMGFTFDSFTDAAGNTRTVNWNFLYSESQDSSGNRTEVLQNYYHSPGLRQLPKQEPNASLQAHYAAFTNGNNDYFAGGTYCLQFEPGKDVPVRTLYDYHGNSFQVPQVRSYPDVGFDRMTSEQQHAYTDDDNIFVIQGFGIIRLPEIKLYDGGWVEMERRVEAEYPTFRVDEIKYKNIETGITRNDLAYYNVQSGQLLLQVPTKETYNELNSWRNWFYPAGEDTLLLTRTCEEYAEASYRLLHLDGTLEPISLDFLISSQNDRGWFTVRKPADSAAVGQLILPAQQKWVFGIVAQDLKTVLLPIEYGGEIITEPKSTYVKFGYTAGYMVLSKDGKYGLVDHNLNVVLPFEYDWLQTSRYHVYNYIKDGKRGVVFPENGKHAEGGFAYREGVNLTETTDSAGTNYLVDRHGNTLLTDPDESSNLSSDEHGRFTFEGQLLDLPAITRYSPWAQEYLDAARSANILPPAQDQLYTYPITRVDFCELAMQLLAVQRPELHAQTEEAFTSKWEVIEAMQQGDYTATVSQVSFYDIDPIWSMAEAVECAAKLGIVTGYPDGSFHPFHTITRQEAATILQRLAKLLELEANGEPLTFKDMNTSSEYAREAISAVSAFETPEDARLMNGIGEDKFDPLGSYTVEQAIVTMYRLCLLDCDQRETDIINS